MVLPFDFGVDCVISQDGPSVLRDVTKRSVSPTFR